MALPTTTVTGFRRVQTLWGESLQQLAARELGDAALWTTIAALNDLAPPYLSATAAPRVARYGDTIMLPDNRPDIVAGKVSAEDVFKTDVKLNAGFLQVSNGDIALVGGRDNLKQAITIRITTSRRELIFHPSYGCDISKLKGRRNDHINALLGKRHVRIALAADDRIAQVISANVDAVGDAMRVEVEARTATGHPINATVTV